MDITNFPSFNSNIGIKTERYTASLGDQENDPDLGCLCEPATETTPRKCARKGTFDIYRCMKAPLVASLPHFYDADESLLELVEGCNPNKVIRKKEFVTETEK